MLDQIPIEIIYSLIILWFIITFITIFAVDWNTYPVHWIVLTVICVLMLLLHIYCACVKLGIGKDWFIA